MSSRLDRALDLFERFVRAAEHLAEAADRDVKPQKTTAPKRARTLTDEEVRQRESEPAEDAFDPGQRADRLVLYIGQAVDVGGRLLFHPRMGELHRLWGRIPEQARAEIEPFVLVYKGDPNRVERALAAVHGMPPWNAKDIHPRPDKLALVEEIVGADAVCRIPYRRDLGVCGGYAIGIQGPRDAVLQALAAMTEQACG